MPVPYLDWVIMALKHYKLYLCIGNVAVYLVVFIRVQLP